MSHYTTDRNIQIHAAKAYSTEFDEKNARQKAREESTNPPAFVPGSGVRHRSSKRRSIKGSCVTKSKGNKGRKKGCWNIHAGL